MVLDGFISGWTRKSLKKTAIIILITAIISVLIVDYEYVTAKTARSSPYYSGISLYGDSSYRPSLGLSEVDVAALFFMDIFIIIMYLGSWVVMGACIYIVARWMGVDTPTAFRSILSLMGLVYIYAVAISVVVYIIAKSISTSGGVLLPVMLFILALYIPFLLYTIKTGIKLIYGNLDSARSWAITFVGYLFYSLLLTFLIMLIYVVVVMYMSASFLSYLY